jgi:peptidoglycan hydrolase-like protein with peptidoglycan-binding domain
MRKIFACAATATVALTLATGCKSDSSDTAARPPAAVPSASSAAPSTPAAPSGSPAPSQPPTANSPSAPARPPKPQKLKAGANGAKVLALQRRLAELGYWNGKADGSFGSLTTQAVYALQKAAGLGRDGVVGPKTQKALNQGVRPRAKSRSGHIVEISLKRQLLMLVDDGTVTQIFNTATGSNQHYEYQGQTYLAQTPPGHFKVSRQIDGQRDGPLGPLWRPKYFNGGIAIHGAPNVPPYPASHGCARVTNAAINWIWAHDKIPLKTKVWVY